MKKTNSMIGAALLGCAACAAAEASATTDKLDVYGVLRVSTDYINVDAPDGGGGLGVSSNTSLFGLRGAVPIDQDYTALYQIEQTVFVDETGGELATRDSYFGVKTPAGQFLFGYMDTPYKYMGLVFSSYTTSAADPHALLGAASSGGSPRLDLRGRSAMQYRGDWGEALSVRAMYSAGYVEDVYGRDENDSDMYSASLIWKAGGGLMLGGAYVRYNDWAGAGTEIDSYRIGARYSLGKLTLKAIFENVDSDQTQAISRDAYGLSAEYNLTGKTRLGAQWIHAAETDIGDDQADQYALVLTHDFNKRFAVHALAAMTRNDDNASYRVTDYGHGDKVGTVAGGDPSVFSVGAQLRF